MKLRDLFESDVTRDIPPVVYFHEQSPAKLADEVDEYIVTGGFPAGHPHHKRVPSGIHEQYVHLLSAISAELDKKGGPELPASWISGFYGSGKSSFAKLLGLALDGVALPDGRSLADALLSRDRSPKADELRAAYARLRQQIDPISVVFDIGGVARDNEHIHSAVVRQVQRRLGYCPEPHVAEMELKLERDGHYPAFADKAAAIIGKPWAEARAGAMADEDFSLVMSELFPERYTDPMAWYTSRAGTFSYSSSAEDATRAIADMLRFRAPGKTLFLVVDEVSQYVHQDNQRMLKLQSFVSDLGQRLKGKVWLLVTGQEKLEEGGDANVLGKMKDRFPPRLRVHLSATNIRDVVHKRLLSKTPQAAETLRARFQAHRNDLKLFAYGCEDATEEDFVEVYPLLPSHIDLILQITSALRTRSSRSQGDDQAIRGLLQLLGELFRSQKLADAELGTLVTLDQVYEVQHTALDSDVQNSMARVLHHCAAHGLDLAARAAKAVALLELISDTVPTDAKLIAACLYDRLDRGARDDEVKEALETLRRENLLGYSEKQGYKIQSSAGEEWERERRDLSPTVEQRSELIQEAIKTLVATPQQPTLDGRRFPWRVLFSDGRRASDLHLVDPRDPAAVTVDFRYYVLAGERDTKAWVNRSAESGFADRLVWLVGDSEALDDCAREYGRSVAMEARYKARAQSLTHDRKRLLLDEANRREDLARALARAVDAAFHAGRFYFRGKSFEARELGGSAATCLAKAAERILGDLFPHFSAVQVSPAEVLQLTDPQLGAPPAKFVQELQIFELDAGKYVPACSGVIPRRVLEYIETEQGVAGNTLLAHFGRPPYGYTSDVVRACVAGLLRAGKLRIQPDGGLEVSSFRDAGAREIFEKDRGFKRADFRPAREGGISTKDRARICRFFETHLGDSLDRENDAIADAVSKHFPEVMETLREVLGRLRHLPDCEPPDSLRRLEKALEDSYKLIRRTEPTVAAVARYLDALGDGMVTLRSYQHELTDEVITKVRAARDLADHQLAQLEQLGDPSVELAEAKTRIREQLAGERPWLGIDVIDDELAWGRERYQAERQRLLEAQEAAAEAARKRVKGRNGFATLTGDHQHKVLRPIAEATANTTADATWPRLTELETGYQVALERAEAEAQDRLDELLSKPDDSRPIRKVTLGIRNRELTSEADLRAFLDELEARLREELKHGHVRLV